MYGILGQLILIRKKHGPWRKPLWWPEVGEFHPVSFLLTRLVHLHRRHITVKLNVHTNNKYIKPQEEWTPRDTVFSYYHQQRHFLKQKIFRGENCVLLYGLQVWPHTSEGYGFSRGYLIP